MVVAATETTRWNKPKQVAAPEKLADTGRRDRAAKTTVRRPIINRGRVSPKGARRWPNKLLSVH